MLSSELLRTRTGKGKIYPQFCSIDSEDNAEKTATEHDLAGKLIAEFEDSSRRRKTRGQIYDVISEMEPDYDYKLVRGLCALLERRSSFVMKRQSSSSITPSELRQVLFSESSRAGLATSDSKRSVIVRKAAQMCGISEAEASDLIWADLDKNYVLEKFDAISVCDLLLWYNMSLAQTLLFRCTKLRFYIDKDGMHWKHVLRTLKTFGLMYTLERDSTPAAKNGNAGNSDLLYCIVEGPLSIFKMTTKYGSAFARLLPVITRTSFWGIDGTISKKTGAGDKLYRFEMSNKTTTKYLRATSDHGILQDGAQSYDSLVEKKFADILYQHLGKNDRLGWRMSREPGPLIAGSKAMLPDFVFERFGRRVYLEIVGFWTPEYLRRKIAKLRDILADSSGSAAATAAAADTGATINNHNNAASDMLVGIDSALLCSQVSEIGSMPGVFLFDGKNITVKPILDHLKRIDRLIEHDAVAADRQIAPDDLQNDLMLLHDFALKYMVPENSAYAILEKSAPGTYIKAGPYAISSKKASEVSGMVDSAGSTRFVDMCGIMLGAGISEECHAELLSFLGYDIIWPDLNPANAQVRKKSGL